jgi:hypothetical protein
LHNSDNSCIFASKNLNKDEKSICNYDDGRGSDGCHGTDIGTEVGAD